MNIILMKKIEEDVNKIVMKILDLLDMIKKYVLHLAMIHPIVILLVLI